jgi:hypothetical protein
MDSNVTRLTMKIGDNEFEAEGSPEYVQQQFQDWKELVKLAVSMAPAPAAAAQPTAVNNGAAAQAEAKPNLANVDADLTKIMRMDGRYISLTARAASVHDAVLILLYGQKAMRNNESVTGTELLSGLASTGGFGSPRLDRILDKLADDGDVMSFGERRGKKYRLTNTGLAKARAIAGDLIAAVA